MIVAFLGILVVEWTHHHASEASEEACAVCQILEHHSLDMAPPAATPMAAVLFILFVLVRSQPVFRVAKALCASYNSRAPPYRTA